MEGLVGEAELVRPRVEAAYLIGEPQLLRRLLGVLLVLALVSTEKDEAVDGLTALMSVATLNAQRQSTGGFNVRQLLDLLHAHGKELLDLDILNAQILQYAAKVGLMQKSSVTTQSRTASAGRQTHRIRLHLHPGLVILSVRIFHRREGLLEIIFLILDLIRQGLLVRSDGSVCFPCGLSAWATGAGRGRRRW